MKTDRKLIKNIIVILVIKVAILWLLWFLFFSHPVAKKMSVPIKQIEEQFL